MKFLLILGFTIFSHIGYGQFYFTLSEKVVKSNFASFKPMEDRGYPAMNNSFLKLRFGGKYYLKQFALLGNLAYSFGESQGASSEKRGAAQGYGLNLGGQYNFHQVQDFRVFAAAEVGFHQYHLKYYYKLLPSNDYGFLQAFHYKGLGVHEDISIGMEKIFSFDRGEFGFGLSFGYRFDQRQWDLLNNKKITNSQAFHNGVVGGIELSYRPIRKK